MWALLSLAFLGTTLLVSWYAWGLFFPGAVARGLSAYARKDWALAAKFAQERLQTARDDPRATRLMARASARMGRHTEALGLYERLIAVNLDAEDHYLIGVCLLRAGQYDDAQTAFKTALTSDPDHAEALHQLTMVTFQRGQVIEAARLAQRLAGRPGWEARGDILLGMIHASDNNPEMAAEALARGLEHDPTARTNPSDKFSASKLLARTLLQMGRSAEALESLRPAIEAGADREAYWLLSRAYVQAGQNARGEEALAKAGDYRQQAAMEFEPSPYVGQAKCGECHRPILKATLATRHARTLDRGQDLLKFPLPEHPLKDPDNPEVLHSFERSGGRLKVQTRVGSRMFHAIVDYALGASDRYMSLVGRDHQGQVRTLRMSYFKNSEESGWCRSKFQFPHPAHDEDYLGVLPVSVDEANECLTCHTTTARSVREGHGPESGDRGIGCERCHGPGGLHITAINSRFPDPMIASPARSAPGQINQLCGTCHSQHFIAMPESFSDPAWARFPGSSLPWSRCSTESRGTLNCVTCHDPHRNAETSPSYYDQKCLTCHAQATRARSSSSEVRATASTATCPVNPSRECVRCHMPRVRNDDLHTRFTDHYIRIDRSSSAGRAERSSSPGPRPGGH
jgi:tetratricopeptide (TPR) repeat protein